MSTQVDTHDSNQLFLHHFRGEGKAVRLSNKPIFPQPLCLSLIKLLSKEPEAHASGACLLLLALTEAAPQGNQKFPQVPDE